MALPPTIVLHSVVARREIRRSRSRPVRCIQDDCGENPAGAQQARPGPIGRVADPRRTASTSGSAQRTDDSQLDAHGGLNGSYSASEHQAGYFGAVGGAYSTFAAPPETMAGDRLPPVRTVAAGGGAAGALAGGAADEPP